MKATHGGKAKNDRIDSHKIALLMRGGNFPLAYVYPKAMQATRDLLRHRTKMVRDSAQFKAHVCNTSTQYNFLSPAKGTLRTASGREGMKGTFDEEIGLVERFASYGRLVKCKAESAGKTYEN